MIEHTQPAGRMTEAAVWLAAFLADGKPRLASDCLQKGKTAGHSEIALRYAKNKLKLRCFDARMGFQTRAACVLVWQLPASKSA